jgi:hypothetical protein
MLYFLLVSTHLIHILQKFTLCKKRFQKLLTFKKPIEILFYNKRWNFIHNNEKLSYLFSFN